MKPLLSTAELAEYLQVPIQTIYGWRHKGEGPIGFRLGKHIRYRVEDVERWLDQQADDREPAA